MMRFMVLILAMLLAGCQVFSTTRVEAVSSRSAQALTLKKVLVLGINTTPEVQKAMEQAFAKRLAANNRVVLLASDWFPGERQPSREQLVARAQAEGVTGILATRLLDYETSLVQEKSPGFSLFTPIRAPGARVGWEQDPWIAGSEGAQRMRENTPVLERKAVVETRLYDAANGEVMWEARSKTLLERDAVRDFDGFAAAIMAQLRKSGWL